jgi:tetratricopeptide (TPR) repeat protein
LLGERENARKWLEIALGFVTPQFRQFVLSELGATYEKLGLIDEAISTLEEVVPLSDKYLRPGYEERLEHLKSIRTS